MTFYKQWFKERIGKKIRLLFWADPQFGIEYFILKGIDGHKLWGLTKYHNDDTMEYGSWDMIDRMWEEYNE